MQSSRETVSLVLSLHDSFIWIYPFVSGDMHKLRQVNHETLRHLLYGKYYHRSDALMVKWGEVVLKKMINHSFCLFNDR